MIPRSRGIYAGRRGWTIEILGSRTRARRARHSREPHGQRAIIVERVGGFESTEPWTPDLTPGPCVVLASVEAGAPGIGSPLRAPMTRRTVRNGSRDGPRSYASAAIRRHLSLDAHHSSPVGLQLPFGVTRRCNRSPPVAPRSCAGGWARSISGASMIIFPGWPDAGAASWHSSVAPSSIPTVAIPEECAIAPGDCAPVGASASSRHTELLRWKYFARYCRRTMLLLHDLRVLSGRSSVVDRRKKHSEHALLGVVSAPNAGPEDPQKDTREGEEHDG